MPVSISAVFSSIITFWQNAAVNINFPEIKLPEWLKEIFGYIFYFISYLISLIPNFPDFDVRATLVITSLGFPFLLDILTVWFTNPIQHTIAHLFDLAASFGTSYLIIHLIYNGLNVYILLFLAICVTWLISHYAYYYTHRKGTLSLEGLGCEINNLYLDGIMPNKKQRMTLEEIDRELSEFLKNVQLVPEVSPIYITIILAIVGIALIIGTLIAQSVIKIGVEIPGTVALFLPIVFVPLAVICFLLAFLKSSECGAKILMNIKQFIKRWGLRLLMLLLEVLYIPVLKSLFENLLPEKQNCLAGTVPSVNMSSSSFNMFERRQFACIPNNSSNTTITELRLYYDPALLYVKDVLIVNGGTILFSIIFIMLGIPFLWMKLIKMNRRFIFTINVYGSTLEEKWYNLATRLETTGIFLFQKYKLHHPNWSVLLLLAKFILLVINTLGVQFSSKIATVLPIYYFVMLFFTIKCSPYLYQFNNILDDLLYIVNCAYSMFPILISYGVNISQSVITYTSLALLVLPLASCILLLFCSPDISDNPTTLTKAMIEYINNEIEEKQRDESSQVEDEDIFNDLFNASEDGGFEYLTDKENYNPNMEEIKERVRIKDGELDSVYDMRSKDYSCKIKIHRLILARRFTKLYNTVDVIIDAQTIDVLISFLNTTVLFASAAFGWYIKALIETSKTV